MKSSTETLIKSLQILAQEIESPDGVANAAIAEAAERLQGLVSQIEHLHKAIYRQQRKEGWHEEHPLVTLCIASPEQCLAEVKAQAVEDVIQYADDNAKNDFDWMKLIQAGCDKLHQQAKGKS